MAAQKSEKSERQPQARAVERKQKITEAALQIIIEHGVHATTHRLIAERAEVPLGSLTYYFESLADILEAAFQLLAQRMTTALDEAMSSAADTEAAVQVLADLICEGDQYYSPSLMVGIVEMYSYANHNERVMEISRDWLRLTQRAMGRHFPASTVLVLDALHEGWRFQQHFTGHRADRAQVVAVLQAIVALG